MNAQQPLGPSDRVARLIGTVFGIGNLPVVPGTLGSIPSAVVFVLVGSHWPVLAILAFTMFVAGVWAAGKCERIAGEEDPRSVVIDEAVGMIVAVIFLAPSLSLGAAAFVIFRFFDIVKPFPLRRLERVGGGWGVMLDDVGAGIYTWVSLFVLSQLGVVSIGF